MRVVTETTTCASNGRAGGPPRERRPAQRKAGRGHSSLAVRGLAASLAAAVILAPAAAVFVSPAAAATNSSLLVQAKAAVLQTDATEEAHKTIPFKRGTKFTVACGVRGTNVLCTEHSGPERCVNNHPWIQLTDVFPIIKGRLGESLTYGLSWTYLYCNKK